MSSEETGWVLAAEPFTSVGVSPVYEDFSKVIPQLLLAGIGGIGTRRILNTEKKSRESLLMSQERIRLIKERSSLIFTRDRILLSSDPDLVKLRKTNDAEKAIVKKEAEIRAQDEKIKQFLAENLTGDSSESRITLWKSGTDLYTRKSESSLLSSLTADKISALITGSLEDIAGYMYVTVQVETGIDTLSFTSVAEAGSYEDIETLVTSLTARLIPEIANSKTVHLRIALQPDDASLFVDGRLVTDASIPVAVFSGTHVINASAAGYASAEKKAVFDSADTFAVTIALEKENLVSVSFNTAKISGSLFMHIRYFGETPLTITVPPLPAIGELVAGDIHTYFIFAPDRLTGKDNLAMTVKPNGITTEKRIASQRSVLYWSLGALYLSLPLSMLSAGIYNNMYQAYVDDKLPLTKSTVNGINNWSQIAIVTRGISIGLGLNTVFQLVRYFIAAEQATPKFAEETVK